VPIVASVDVTFASGCPTRDIFEMPKSSTFDDDAASLARQVQVARLQIAVDDAVGVRLGHRRRRLHDHVDRFSDGELPSLLELPGEVVSLEELHHEIRQPLGRDVDVDDASGVRAAQLTGGAGLALEARTELGRREHLRLEHLDGHALPDADVRRLVDDPHPSLADDTPQPVLAGDRVARRRHAGRALLHDPGRIPPGRARRLPRRSAQKSKELRSAPSMAYGAARPSVQ
jgi:hypothetical protein